MLNKFFFHYTLFFSFFVFSQNHEVELWGKMNFKDKINKNLFFSLEPGSRYNLDNFFFTKQFLDISLEQYIYKGHLGELSFEIGGRLTKLPNQIGLGKRQYLTTYYSKKIKKFNITSRTRLFFEQNITNYNRQYFRNKFTLQYNEYDFFRPFIDGEYLYGLNSDNVNKFRYSLGGSFRFSKKTTIKIFYRLQNSEEIIQKKKTIFGVYLSQKL